MKLFCPINVREMSREKFLSGGCGPEGWKVDLVPDSLLGLDIRDCCRIHDGMYSLGDDGTGLTGSENHRGICDNVFLNNMLRVIRHKPDQWGWVRDLRIWLARRYYRVVADCGGPAYWDNKNQIDEFVSVSALPSA